MPHHRDVLESISLTIPRIKISNCEKELADQSWALGLFLNVWNEYYIRAWNVFIRVIQNGITNRNGYRFKAALYLSGAILSLTFCMKGIRIAVEEGMESFSPLICEVRWHFDILFKKKCWHTGNENHPSQSNTSLVAFVHPCHGHKGLFFSWEITKGPPYLRLRGGGDERVEALTN